MPGGNKRGGKKFKKGKKQTTYDKELILKDVKENQEYSKIIQVNGGGRYKLFCFDGVERLGICAGNIKKKVRLELNNIVLVSLWEFQDTKCSIIHKYDDDEIYKLKDMNEFPSTVVIDEENQFSGMDDTFNFTNTNLDDKSEDSETSEKSDSESEDLDSKLINLDDI